MNMQEFEKVKNMTYLGYCDYLQKKYGIGRSDYMTKTFNKNPKVSRTKEGLYAHHKMEDRAPWLSNEEWAKNAPFEWQQKENIVYCDALEHLFLHVLIYKYPSEERISDMPLGVSGIFCFMAPELNDVYSGWVSEQTWRRTCHEKVIDDKDVYLSILKLLFDIDCNNDNIKVVANDLLTSYGEDYGVWSKSKNSALFEEILALEK